MSEQQDIKTNTMTETTEEELLSEVHNRFVLYPIKYNNVWNMYKKAEAAFWTAEELDLSKDMADWEKLNENEKHFIKHVLAFFAGSDGIVNENLGVRFMNDVKIPEAKSFYGFQIAMENIHCVASDTMILTRDGYAPIDSVAGKKVHVWNGSIWSEVTPYKTASGADVFEVVFSNGASVNCTAKHKWFLADGNMKLTESLSTGDQLMPFKLPEYHDFTDPTIFMNPYDHGKQAVEMSSSYDRTKYSFVEQLFVPMNYSIPTKLKWLSGLISSSKIDVTSATETLIVNHESSSFLKEVQLMLTTLGVFSTIAYASLSVNRYNFHKLVVAGLPLEISLDDTDYSNFDIVVVGVKPIGTTDTYCFDEPLEHKGVFNGILAGNSETYSLLIDTYIKDPHEKYRLLNAINTIPCIKKKADWAIRWIEDEDSSFAKRLVAFACVEGIFFSGAFCAIFWMKERGVMPGLCLSNEFISRDESLHTEFAVLLYSMIHNKLPQETIHQIISEAVEIEDEFINQSIPCNLLGMNSALMSQYIKFVADRLLVQLGYERIWNFQNPFDFMNRINLEHKANFFEDRNSQYSIANVGNKNAHEQFEFGTDADF